MTVPKAVALAVTDYHGPFYDDGKKTGAYFSEVYHPWKVITQAGFKVQLVSENGKFGWDDHSVAEPAIAPEELAILNDKSHEFNKFLDAIKPVKDLSYEDFGVVFAAGGHGTVFDFDGNAPGLAKFFADVYEEGGLATAVCHGPVLLGFVNGKDGKPIINGKLVTGFADEGETLMHLDAAIERTGKKRVKEVLVHAGGKYDEPNPPFNAHVVEDQRVITGANPASATPIAEAIVKAYNRL